MSIVVYRGTAGVSSKRVKKSVKNSLATPHDSIRINLAEQQSDAAMNGTNNVSVPLFDDANLVQFGDAIQAINTPADGTIFFVRQPGIYHVKLSVVIVASNAVQLGIARNPSDDYAATPVDGQAIFDSLSTEPGLINGTRVTTPLSCELPMFIDAHVIVNSQQIARSTTLSDGTTTEYGVAIVPLIFSETRGGSPNGTDIAEPRANFHVDITRVAPKAMAA